MNSIILIVCLVGVNFASHLNESTEEHKDANKEKDESEQLRIIDVEESIEHRYQQIGTGRIQTKDPKQKSGSFPVEFLLNLNSGEGSNNMSPLLDSKESQNNPIQYEKEEMNEEYEFSTDESSEQYESSLMKPDIQSVELDENDKQEYINMLEEAYDDKDIIYVLNTTQNDDTSEERVKNETYNEIYIKKNNQEDVIFHNTSESEIHISEQDNDDEVDDSRKSKSKNLIHGKNYTNLRFLSSGFTISQQETSQGEENNQQSRDDIVTGFYKVRGDVPEVEYTGEITDNDQNESNTNKDSASPNSLKNPINNFNTSDLHVDHGDHDFHSAMEKEEDSNTAMNKSTDPCNDFHCKRGKTCKIDGQGNPFCACQDPDFCLPVNLNDRVCGTDNKTYNSVCHLFGTKCQLQGTKEGNHLHLDYQGPCKYIPPCTDYELVHFPFRMRDWLKNVLMQLYERGLENTGLLSEKQRIKVKKIYEDEKRLEEGDHNIDLLVKDFQKHYHMYVYPVHWQFHQLDQHSVDRLLTVSEMAPLRAPLIPMEHCVAAFLQECNTNNDRHISLQEWCLCFGIREGDIDENLLF
ncbi:SPARC-like protein 1 [Mixophyes fleayi]|uniref:SPARC-like protein 1 n=1 Tax=Mixophyes fleayi TaxID=3061075 RepID=UPI003F4E00AB